MSRTAPRPRSEHPGLSHVVPARGYALYLLGAGCFALNGTVSKTILMSGIDAARLSQLRVTAAFAILFVVVALTRPAALRLRRSELRLLALYSILGLAMTQWLYFVSIARLPVGVALLIEFTAPIMVALWARFAWHQHVRRLVWVALALALAGLAMVAQVWQGFHFDGLGVAAAFAAGAALAVYYLSGERQLRAPRPRDPVSLTMWGFGAAAAFWAVVQPWWSFPFDALAGQGQPLGPTGPAFSLLALVTWMIVLGTVVPFWLVLAAMRDLSAAQASSVGMVEPILAGLVAWVALGEAFTLVQCVGAVVVLAGVVLAQRSR